MSISPEQNSRELQSVILYNYCIEHYHAKLSVYHSSMRILLQVAISWCMQGVK